MSRRQVSRHPRAATCSAVRCEEIPFASYLFYRYADPETGKGGETTPDEIVAHARDLAARYGFTTHKLKGGVFPPEHDVEVTRGASAPPSPKDEAPPRSEQRLDRSRRRSASPRASPT